MTDEEWLTQAIELAEANVAAGGGPFGAVVARDGDLVATGRNLVTATLDPSAHAEVVAIRAAGTAIGDFSLAGCSLFTSCEPCPMCLAASLWARLDRVVYAADRDDAAAGGFDDRAFYDLFGLGPHSDTAGWPTRVEELRLPGCETPFEAWRAHADRTDY
ncbi:MAG: nucleoside deaminase [Nocardioides sp.]|uniref:nucleoside deaminase n=1 Tax=Nocardioides sp. TaxID=35761 RepID=UPI0039E4CC43